MEITRKTALATALAVALGVCESAAADIITASYGGWFTMLDALGTSALVNGDAPGAPMYTRRSAITGTITYNSDVGAGTATMNGFSFNGGGFMVATDISLQAIGNGNENPASNPGSLILGNTTLSWNGSNGMPLSIVWDASGFFRAIDGGLTTSDVITGGSLAATDDFLFPFGSNESYTLPMGAAPLATTTFNTTDIGSITLGTDPSGTLPLTDDGIGGSPMMAGPFPAFNFNMDITQLEVVSVSYIPVPAAVWLFGSGLLGLAGLASRRKAG